MYCQEENDNSNVDEPGICAFIISNKLEIYFETPQFLHLLLQQSILQVLTLSESNSSKSEQIIFSISFFCA